MTASVFDSRSCLLGEGPLWHPLRKQLFWFDILNKKLMSMDASGPLSWSFDDYVSAAGWVDEHRLLVASATGLWRYDLTDDSKSLLCPLEKGNTKIRSNDGRADPWGGFWIGTMGINAAKGAGAIYRYYQGRLQQLYGGITISNAICFAPDRKFAYFTDTPTRQVMRVAMDRYGWPEGEPSVLVDLTQDALNPDGAVTDSAGNLWIAQWGAGRVVCYSPEGALLKTVALPAQQITCPAFGGDAFDRLFVTSATEGLSQNVLRDAPKQGMTFACDAGARGLAEPQVIL